MAFVFEKKRIKWNFYCVNDDCHTADMLLKVPWEVARASSSRPF